MHRHDKRAKMQEQTNYGEMTIQTWYTFNDRIIYAYSIYKDGPVGCSPQVFRRTDTARLQNGHDQAGNVVYFVALRLLK